MQRGFAPIFILIGITVILAVAGSAYYLNNLLTPMLKLQNSIVVSQSPKPTNISQPTQTPDETANWKVYTNKANKFTFEYPGIWYIASETNDTISIGQKAINGYQVFLNITTDKSKFTDSNSFKFCSQIDDNKPQHCIDDGKGWNQPQPIEKTIIDGKDALSFYLAGGVDYAFHVVQISNQQDSVELKMDVAGGGLEGSFEKILSTFRFD